MTETRRLPYVQNAEITAPIGFPSFVLRAQVRLPVNNGVTEWATWDYEEHLFELPQCTPRGLTAMVLKKVAQEWSEMAAELQAAADEAAGGY